MYCPRCSAENDAAKRFCRQCGLPLTAVRLAAAGRVDEAIEKIRKGENALKGGAITLIICAFVALLNGVLFMPRFGLLSDLERTTSGSGLSTLNWILNLILGLAIGAPIMLVGLARLRGAKRLLDAAEAAPLPPAAAPVELPARRTTSGLREAPGSVAEHTTLHLEAPDQQHS